MTIDTNDIRICFIGDSYTQGTGDDDCLGWSGRVCASARRTGHNVTGYNLGVRRETSADIARRWLAECEPRLLPTTRNYAVFAFGANDVVVIDGVRRVAEHETIANLHAMLAIAKPRYRTLMIGPPPALEDSQNVRLERLSGLIQEAAARADVPCLALFPSLANDDAWRTELRNNDGAHPFAAGYQKIAAMVEAWEAWPFRKTSG